MTPSLSSPPHAELLPEHPASSCREAILTWESLVLQVQLASARSTIARIILRCMAPLRLARGMPRGARLQPGWDGSLGYACYAVELPVGCTSVSLEIAAPAGDPTQSDDLAIRHDAAPDDATDLNVWQRRRRSELAARLMGPRPDRPEAVNARCESRTVGPGFALESWRCSTRPGHEIPFLLARPDQAPRGLLIALHGHEGTWGGTDIAAFAPGHADSFCHDFAAAGWAVLQPASMDHLLDAAGWTLLGSWCWDAMACLGTASRLLGAMPVTAVCGLSAGGQIAMAMLALDRRLQAGVVAGAFSTWNHYRNRMIIPPHCDCGTTSLLGGWLEQGDWLALAAPCAVQIQHGRADGCFGPGADPALLDPAWNRAVMPQAEFAAAARAAQRAWTTLGVSKSCQVHLHDHGHVVDSAAALKWCAGIAS